MTLLPEYSQMILSPGPLIQKLRTLLKNITPEDYLLLSGDPAIIGVTCSSGVRSHKWSLQIIESGIDKKKLITPSK